MSCPTCHGPSKFQRRQDRRFTSLMGTIVLQRRAYYYCASCHAGHAPVDVALGLAAHDLTPAAEQVVALAGTTGCFAEAAEKLLPRMAGLRLAESTVERITEAAGARLGALWADGQTLGPKRDWRFHRDAQGRTTAYVSVDATGIGIQGPGAARAEGRMVWVGKVYNPRVEPDAANPKPRAGTARYLAGLMSLDELGTQLRRQAAQVGMDGVAQWVALTDGGNGLDDFMDVFFPRAERILDFYHAAGHLGELARAYCGEASDAAVEQAAQWCHQMKHEGGQVILATLEALDLKGQAAATREVHRRVTQYVRKDLHRMDYPRYQARGWQIGSGHIEAACKTVVNERLKQSGMRWGCDGADAVCHLRALYEGESSQWDAFWEHSIN